MGYIFAQEQLIREKEMALSRKRQFAKAGTEQRRSG